MFRSFFVREQHVTEGALTPVSMPNSISKPPAHLSTGSLLCTPDVVSLADSTLRSESPNPAPTSARACDPTHAHAPQDAPNIATWPTPVPSPSPVPVSSVSNEKVFDGYLSDMEDDAFVIEEEDVDDWYNKSHKLLAVTPMLTEDTHDLTETESSAHKRQKLDLPI
jgi:hypothetical protein